MTATLPDDATSPRVVVSLDPEVAIDVPSVIGALPKAGTLASGTLVIVLPCAASASFADRVFAAFRRAPRVPRTLRCGALLASGFVRIGAGTDTTSRLDVVWGYAP